MPHLLVPTAFLICLMLTPAIRRLAHAKGWLAAPVKDRWHTQPTALMGGIAIYTAFLIALLPMLDYPAIVSFFTGNQSDTQSLPGETVLLIGATFFVFTGAGG